MRPLLLPGPAPTQSELAPGQRSEEPRPTTARHACSDLRGAWTPAAVWAGLPGRGGDAARRLPLRTTPLPRGPSCPSHRAALPPGVRGWQHQTPPPHSGKGPGGRATPQIRGAGLAHPPPAFSGLPLWAAPSLICPPLCMAPPWASPPRPSSHWDTGLLSSNRGAWSTPRVHRPLFSHYFRVLRKPQSRALAPKAVLALALDLTRAEAG